MELLDAYPWLPVVAALIVMSVFAAGVRRVITAVVIVAALLVLASAVLHPLPLGLCPVPIQQIRS